MARYPNAVWRPVGNFGYPRGTHGQLEPVAIVDHIAQGTMAGMDAWFANPASEASAHFAVGKLGQVHQYVDLGDAAWANGKKDRPDSTIPWMAVANPNLVTISIEHEGYTGEAWTEAMYAADLALHRWLVDAFNIPIDDNHIVGHYRIDSVNRARCPGSGWPKVRLFQDLKEDDDMDDATVRKIVQEEMAKPVPAPTGAAYLPYAAALPAEFAGKWPTWSAWAFVQYLVMLLKRRDNAIAALAARPVTGGQTAEQVKTIIRATKLSP